MSLTSLIWIFIASAIAMSALLAFAPRFDAAKLALLSRLRTSSWRSGDDRRGFAGKLIVPAAVFLLVAGIGAAASYYVGHTPAAIDSHSQFEPNEALAQLKDYARSIGTEEPASMRAPDKLLPDVNTMIERLAARLETAPEDAKGWRMRPCESGRARSEFRRAQARVRGSQGQGLRDSFAFANRGRRQG
jgi:hypothetical protein